MRGFDKLLSDCLNITNDRRPVPVIANISRLLTDLLLTNTIYTNTQKTYSMYDTWEVTWERQSKTKGKSKRERERGGERERETTAPRHTVAYARPAISR